MTEFDPETEIEALIETYADGLNDLDGDAVTACFAFPCTIWQIGKGHVFADATQLAENTTALFKMLEEQGVVTSNFDVHTISVSGSSAFATVTWQQEDADGVVVMEPTFHYTLVYQDDRWKIALIVDEAEDLDDDEDFDDED